MAAHTEGGDASFAEYVAARWSMHYRLAVLLAGEDGADELTQRALVRAYVAWSEIQDAASADDEVKKIVAATAVHESQESPVQPADGRPTAEASDRERLWVRISALPRRQRALLVLRHYEGFSDRDIAGVVKSTAKTVGPEVRALEAGIDLADLRAELAGRADEALVPLPPIDVLVSDGQLARRQHKRRIATRAGVVVTVMVAALALTAVVERGSSGPGRGGGPTPPADVPVFLTSLPHRGQPEIPYSVRRFLYLPGGRGVDLAEQPAAIVQTPGWVYVAYRSGKIVRVDVDDPAIEVVTESSGGQLVADADGEQVAWLEAAVGGAQVHVQAADPQAPSDGGTVWAFPVELRCCDNPFEVNGITADGGPIASLPAESRAWVGNDEGVREVNGMGNGVVGQVLAHGLVVRYPPLHFALGRIEDGNFLQVAEIAAVSADFSDPTARRIVYADTDGEIHVREVPTRGRSRRGETNIRLRLPTLDDGFAAARWEDENHVILDVTDETTPDGALVRCDVRDGACELADKLEGPHILAR
jgi:DNA-directed RNA polymerase specialized sigma24 family protein